VEARRLAERLDQKVIEPARLVFGVAVRDLRIQLTLEELA
jgi:hypothetical protein